MASFRQIAACIGLSSNFRVVRDFYGYVTSVPQKLSLLKQLRLLKSEHVHLNLIRVGIESFTLSDESEIDFAVQMTRDTYAPVKLGIGRVRRYFIPTSEANGHEHISSDSEAEDLTNEFSVSNDALDVFFVLTYASTVAGSSPTCGTCDKYSKRMTGTVVAIEDVPLMTAATLAHEIGHYLGLDHEEDNTNIMFESVVPGGTLTADQGSIVRDHCFVKAAC
jgi:hypothetical protein